MKLLLITLIALFFATTNAAHCIHKRVHVQRRNQNIQCPNGYVMRGMHRNRVDNLSGITHLWCCKLPGNGGVHRHTQNWVRSFDHRGWSTCHNGWFMNGFRKSRDFNLYNIEYGLCQRRNAPRYQSCYTERSIVGALDRPGWAICRRGGYYMAGMWRNTHNHRDRNRHKLHRIEYFKCCKPKTNNQRLRVCYSTGDPHYRTFAGRRFDNMYRGTFVFGQSKYFLVHTKTGVWNRRTSVNIATGVRVNGKNFVFSDRYNNKVRVNGRWHGLRNGRNNVGGVIVDKHGSRVFIRRGREYVSIQTNYNAGWRRYGQTQYQNVAFSGFARSVGICGGKGVHAGKGIFKHVTKRVKIIAVTHCTRKQTNTAKNQCARRFRTKSGRLYNWCVFDTCRGLRAKWAANWAKQIKYWQTILKRYNTYAKNHKRTAKVYYKRYLHHLEKMRIHGRAYRKHLKARNAHIKARNAHNHHAGVHFKHRNNHYRARNAHNHHARRNYNLYKHFSRLANMWRNRINHANNQIRNCKRHINSQKKKRSKAIRMFNYYNHKKNAHYNAHKAHAKAAAAHHRAAVAHNKAAYRHIHHRNAHQRAINYHNKYLRHHLAHRNHHARHANNNKRAYHAHNNAANIWAGRMRNVRNKIRHLVKLRQAEFRKEVKVYKLLKVRSRTCKTVPKYLDSVKYYTSKRARQHAINRCRHRDRRVFYSCVYDHSKGIFHTKREYDRLAALQRRNKGRYTCYSWGDPHNKPFIGRAFNVYHQTGWKNILRQGNLLVRGYLTYTPTWGRRSINRYAQIILGGKSVFFQPWGRFSGRVAGFHMNHNAGHFKRWYVNAYGYHIRIQWHRSRSGGYYSVWVSTKLGKVRGCSGYCCNQHTRKRKGGKALKNGNPYSVRFGSKCQRKTTAFRICAYSFRQFRRNRAHFNRVIRNCVNGRRHL